MELLCVTYPNSINLFLDKYTALSHNWIPMLSLFFLDPFKTSTDNHRRRAFDHCLRTNALLDWRGAVDICFVGDVCCCKCKVRNVVFLFVQYFNMPI